MIPGPSFPVTAVYTDGSCRNRGPEIADPMTYACVIDILPYRWTLAVYVPPNVINTNNRAELYAPLLAFGSLNPCPRGITITTDSLYVMKAATGENKAYKNVDLIDQLQKGTKLYQVRWAHIRGHTGHSQNELADSLCSEAYSFGDPSWTSPRTVVCELTNTESGKVLISSRTGRREFTFKEEDGLVWKATAILF